jgi:hypothetical protein
VNDSDGCVLLLVLALASLYAAARIGGQRLPSPCLIPDAMEGEPEGDRDE